MSGMFRSNPAVGQAIATSAITQKPLVLPAATSTPAPPMALPDPRKPVPDITNTASAQQRAGGTLAGQAMAGGLYAGQRLGG